MNIARAISRKFQGYSHADMARVSEITRAENPRLRWLFPVTRASRSFLQVQIRALQVAYVGAVLSIYVAARSDRVVNEDLLNVWLIEALANVVVRSLLYIPVFRASPAAVAASPLLRCIPVAAVTIIGAHWVWTVAILAGPTLNLTVLVMLLSFVWLSVASVAILPASPAACFLNLAFIWAPLAFKLAGADWFTPEVVFLLAAGLTACLWATFRTVVTGVRSYLVQGDEFELLVAELRERNQEVESLRRAAASDLEARTAFFASASHDFRQRVHAMKLLTHSGVSEAALPGKDKSAFVRLTGVVDDLETYITDVLEFAKFEGVPLSPERRPIRLQALFQQLDVEFEDVATERRVDLRLRATTIIVNTDESMLLRILENLTSNAIKFSNAGVLIAARRRNGEVCIEVRDQGPGVPTNAVDAVFDAFYQSYEGADETRKGVGLGLAIVKRLSNVLGYRAEIVSCPGRGTLVRLNIPARDVITV